MASEKPKGSIIYEILIVILVVALIASIIYPKIVKDKEEQNVQLSRYRMDEILKAELQYQRYHSKYNDTLSIVIDFIRNSPEYSHYIDSVIVGGLDSIMTRLGEFKQLEQSILADIPQATDTLMIDSLGALQISMKYMARDLAGYIESVHDRMKILPNMPIDDLVEAFKIVDSKLFTLDMDIVKNSIEKGDLQAAAIAANDAIAIMEQVTDDFARVKAKVPDYRDSTLDSLAYCATTRKPFVLVHLDTSAIKYLNIYSPIDSNDIAMVQQDFLKSRIGGLQITNHGKIESGEKSWEQAR